MDLKSLIESGALETYVLGLCSPEETVQMEQLLQQYPELRAELEAVEHALEQVARAYAVTPPPGLRERILERIAPRGEGGPQATAARKQQVFRWQRALPWAAVAVLGVALVGQVWEKRRLQVQHQDLSQQVTACEERLRQHERLQEVLALLRDRNTRALLLSDAAGKEATKTTAVVWYNPIRAEVILDIASLPAPPPGRYLQLWAIADGRPVSLGMVQEQEGSSFQKLPFLPNAQAFAVSVEDKPQGNPTPTQVLLIGKI